MGVGCCKLAATPESKAPLGGLRVSDFRKPRWKSEQPMTLDQIQVGSHARLGRGDPESSVDFLDSA